MNDEIRHTEEPSIDERVACLAKALSHPARLRIVQLLARQTECMGAEVFDELPLAQSTVSGHLRVLRDAGIVRATPLGVRTLYCLVPESLDPLRSALSQLAEDSSPHADKGCP